MVPLKRGGRPACRRTRARHRLAPFPFPQSQSSIAAEAEVVSQYSKQAARARRESRQGERLVVRKGCIDYDDGNDHGGLVGG
eukprot:2946593-Pyramimonas_sp.AAC.1